MIDIENPAAESMDIQAADFDSLPEHIDIVFDGVSDTLSMVEGTEGLSFAQQYLYGAMHAQGMVTQLREGNEAAMDAIKKTFGKAIAYLQKIFRGIWEFFFKKKNAETAVKEANANILECKKVVNTVEFKEKIKVIDIEDDVKSRGATITKLAEKRNETLKEVVAELEKMKETEPRLFTDIKAYADKMANAEGDAKTFSSTDFHATLATCEYYVKHADDYFSSVRQSESFYKKYYESFEILKQHGIRNDNDQAPEQEKGVTVAMVMKMLKTWITGVAKITKLNLQIVKQCESMSAFIQSKK